MGGTGMVMCYPVFGQCLETSVKLYKEDNPNYVKITGIMMIPFILNFGGLYLFRLSV
jgi:hypothetical protein